jgi:hypothetical protein
VTVFVVEPVLFVARLIGLQLKRHLALFMKRV